MAFELQLLKELTEVETREDTSLGIMRWGTSNAFPQTLKNLIDKSPSSKPAVSRTAKFYKGGSFIGEDTIINSSGQTLKDVVAICADELATFNAYALHGNFNIKGAVSSITNLRIAELRFNQFDELNTASKIGYHPDFGYNALVKKTIRNTVTRDKIKWINKFNPENVLDQIKNTRGGVSNYQGQVLYQSPEGSSSYPIPTLQAQINFVLADIENSILVRKETSTGFINSYLLKTMLSNDNPNLIALENAIIEAQGARGSGKVITLSGLSEEEMKATVLEPILSGNGSGDVMDNCVTTNDLSKKVICDAYLIPPLLAGTAESTGFSSQELRDSYFIFNAITQDGRDYIEAGINRMLKHSNFSIKSIKLSPLTLEEATNGESSGEKNQSKTSENA